MFDGLANMPIKELVLASGNPAKLAELTALLDAESITVHAQNAFDVPEAEETGLTFVENALIKARNAAQHTDLPAIGDDSGLEVDALDGAPGIYSSRYAGSEASDTDNVAKLLEQMDEVPSQQRTARFQCIVVLLRHANDPTPLICHGTWEGTIAREPRGNSGFGYDPIFFVPSHGCTAAELPVNTKNRISHRARALRELQKKLVPS